MLNRAYFGWISSYHLCINLVCISIRLCVISGLNYLLFCIVFWCACILTIIDLFDLLIKMIKTSKEK